MDNKVFFFLSPGRCGTKWLAKNFHDNFRDKLKVLHEPVPLKKRLGSCYLENSEACERSMPELISWVNHIKNQLINKSFMWTGWDCYSLIPYFIEKIGEDRTKVIILKRNYPNLFSSISKSAFYNDNTYNKGQHPTPLKNRHLLKFEGDFKNFTTDQRKYWYINEIYYYGDYLRGQFPDVPFYDFFIDSIFKQDRREIRKFLKFLQLPWRDSFYDSCKEIEDQIVFNNGRGVEVDIHV